MRLADLMWALKAGWKIKRDPMPLFRELASRRSGQRKIFIFSRRTHIITSVGDVKRILHDNEDNYYRDYVSFEQVMGQSLLMSEGKRWHTLRKGHEPAFRGDRLSGYIAPMEDAVARVGEQWAEAAASGHPLNLSRSMSGLMLDVTARALFRCPPPCPTGEFHQRMMEMSAALNQRALRLSPLIRKLAVAGSHRYRDALARWHGLEAKVRGTARHDAAQPSLLSLIEQAARQVATAPADIERQVHDDILGYLVAGTHTTATTLGWAFHLIAAHPDAADRLRREAADVLSEPPRTTRDLSGLHYARMVLQETMRLYPPAWCFILTARGDDTLEHCSVGAGEQVALCMPGIYRDARHWDEPDRFHPERFSPRAARTRAPYSYLPFGAGRRSCIGGRFAMMEMSLALSRLVSRFHLTTVTDRPIRLEAGIVLKPAHDLYLRISPLH